MKNCLQLIGLISIPVLLSTSMVFAQVKDPALPDPDLPENTSAEEAAVVTEDIPASQEVDITEDNYRQFMELKDARGQRNMLPENAFKPGSGLQKLDKLPEESQKHLRNQLREIIVQGDQWQPGDEDKDYPYVPSEAALANQPLQKQEAEAWGELVDSYHKREGQIHENSARSQAAMASEDGSAGKPGGGSGNEKGSSSQSASQGTGQAKDGEVAQESAQRRSESENTAGGYSPNGSSEQGSAGVSQNAMEFLKGLGNQGSNAGGGNSDSPSDGDGQSQEQSLAGQQGTSEQNGAANRTDPNSRSMAGSSQSAMEYLQGNTDQGNDTAADGTAPPPPRTTSADANAESVAGTSQNALEFLQETGNQNSQAGEGTSESSTGDSGQGGQQEQADAQAGQQSSEEQERTASNAPEDQSQISTEEPESESTTGTSQNAFEYLAGESANEGQGAPPDPATPTGTLSIQDLLNAQGLLDGTDTTGTTASGASDSGDPVKTLPDKDSKDGDGENG